MGPPGVDGQQLEWGLALSGIKETGTPIPLWYPCRLIGTLAGIFLFHVAVAMELMLLLPFTKFAHAIYRPVALFFHALAADKSKQTT